MIPRAYITEWRKKAPWKTNAQVEQDLVIDQWLWTIFHSLFSSSLVMTT